MTRKSDQILPDPGTGEEGAAPRFPELPVELDERQRALYDVIASGPRGEVRGPLAMMLYSPDLATHAQALGEFARYHSMFAPLLSELIILVVARQRDCHFEWSSHASIAAKAGVPENAIQDIRNGLRPTFEDADQAIVYEFVSQLQETNRVGQDVFERFFARFGEKGVVEATGIMGYYTLLAFMMNAAGTPATGEGLPVRPIPQA